jgi:anti-anti-sigma factor
MALELAVGREVTRERYAGAEAMLAAVEFRVDVARERDIVRVCPVGEVDVATIASLRERMDEAMAAGPGCLILDLRGVMFLDSAGLHLAVEADAWAARNGIEFAIIPGPPAVQRTFEVAGLSARLPFVDVPRA